jgi:hypothetical protein
LLYHSFKLLCEMACKGSEMMIADILKITDFLFIIQPY